MKMRKGMLALLVFVCIGIVSTPEYGISQTPQPNPEYQSPPPPPAYPPPPPPAAMYPPPPPPPPAVVRDVEADKRECTDIARKLTGDSGDAAARGAIIGGLGGAAAGAGIGAATGGKHSGRSAGIGAGIGGLIGILGGAAIGSSQAEDQFRKAYTSCMAAKGYEVR